jgi:ABC-2 type transport system permease protein
MIHRIRALIRKELKQVSRDKRTLAVLLFFPMFLLVIFGYAVNFDVQHIKTAILDQNLSSESRELIHTIGAYHYFDIVTILSDYNEIDTLINTEQIQAAVIIPVDFSHRIQRRERTEVQFIVDGVNGNTGQTATGYFARIVQSYSELLTIRVGRRYGLEMKPLLNVEERIWYNPELKSTKFLIPGLIAFILMITAVVSTALSVVREKEQSTIEQVIVSPISAVELMVGKAIPYMFISLTAAFLILLAGQLLFDVEIRGSLLTLSIASIIFLIGALGQGLLISTIAHTQAVAFMMAILSSLLPTLLLSGFIFRLDSMPPVLQIISYIVPARYFLVILRGVILKGTGVTMYADQFLFLVAFVVLMIAISSLKMTRGERL